MSDLRYSKNIALLAKVEAVSGVAETTHAATDVIFLVDQPDVKFEAFNIPRKAVRPFYGMSEEIPATGKVVLKFRTELVASGVAGTAPPIGKLLRGCGFVEAITAGNRVEYAPLSQGQESLTFRFFKDGVRYVCQGARGTAKLNLIAYEIPTVDFEFWGLYRSESVAALPTVDYTANLTPLAVTDANSGDIKIGSALAAGVLTGGTTFKSKGISIDLGNDLKHFMLLGGEQVGITTRQISGHMDIALDETNEVQWYSDIRTVTKTTLSFAHGTTAGAKIIVFGTNVQRKSPQWVDDAGRMLLGVDLGFLSASSTGNDELKLVFK